MKKLSLFALTAALALSLAACGGEKAPETTPTPEPAPAPTETVAETAQPEAPVETEDPALREKRLAAYQFALQQFAFEHVWPDGEDIWFDGEFGFMEDNFFAICDVDGDGSEELVLRLLTAPMAGMAEHVYGYDAEADAVYEELSGFPCIVYYTEGLADLGISHNQGYAGDALWPYSAYRYNAETGVYDFAASTDAWSREMHPEGYPADVDTEGADAVYYVSEEYHHSSTQPISKSAFEAWKAEFYGSAVQLELPLQSVGEENIAAVTD